MRRYSYSTIEGYSGVGTMFVVENIGGGGRVRRLLVLAVFIACLVLLRFLV